MEIITLSHRLRTRLVEYRNSRKNKDTNIHINAVEIALCLVEYAIEKKRPIETCEHVWFQAGYQIEYLLSGSNWEDLSEMYNLLVVEVEHLSFFS